MSSPRNLDFVFCYSIKVQFKIKKTKSCQLQYKNEKSCKMLYFVTLKKLRGSLLVMPWDCFVKLSKHSTRLSFSMNFAGGHSTRVYLLCWLLKSEQLYPLPSVTWDFRSKMSKAKFPWYNISDRSFLNQATCIYCNASLLELNLRSEHPLFLPTKGHTKHDIIDDACFLISCHLYTMWTINDFIKVGFTKRLLLNQ